MAETLVDIKFNAIVNGFVGDPDIAICVPVYDENEDIIRNYIGWNQKAVGATEFELNIGGDVEGGSRGTLPHASDHDTEGVIYTAGGVTAQWNLLYAIRQVFLALGYENVDMTAYECAPFNRIYIAAPTGMLRDALPHWTAKDFIKEVQNFLGAIASFSDEEKKVTFIRRNDYRYVETVLMAEDDFTLEVEEDSKVNTVFSTEIDYDISESEHHDYDKVDWELIDSLPTKEYGSYEELLQAYNSSSEKEQVLWKCPQGMYAQWLHESFVSPLQKLSSLQTMTAVNMFGTSCKEEDGITSLKICPAAMSDDFLYPVILLMTVGGNPTTYYGGAVYIKMPVIEGVSIKRSPGRFKPGIGSINYNRVQIAIEDGNIPEEENDFEKPDRMEVFLYDGTLNNALSEPYGDSESRLIDLPIPMGFTSYDYKCEKNANHQNWSLAVTGRNGVKNMSIARPNLRLDTSERYCIRFLSSEIPNPEDIFIIKSKRYMAEKIEVEIKDGIVNKLMTGYFYKIQE